MDPLEMRRQRAAYLGAEVDDFSSKILAGIEANMPTINETGFRAYVIPLLEKLFVPDSIQKYKRFCGDLSNPLRVHADNDKNNILFTVPAVFQIPLTTIPQMEGGLTVADVIANMGRYRDLNQSAVIDDTMQSFLDDITIVPDKDETIIIPIDNILRKYGTKIDLYATAENPNGTPAEQLRMEGKPAMTMQTVSPTSNCFTEEEDED
jgi:hypothetical protein